MAPKIRQEQHPLPWGLSDVEQVAAGDWRSLRTFVREHLPTIAQRVDDGSWDESIGFRPWGDLGCVLSPGNHMADKVTIGRADGSTVVLHPVKWRAFLREQNIGETGDWTDATRRLAIHAGAVLAGKSVRDAVERILRRPLLQEELDLSPDHPLEEWDKAQAALCVGYARGKLLLCSKHAERQE